MVKGQGSQLQVSRFTPGKPAQKEPCSTEVDDLVRTVVKLGGDYGDVIQLLRQAKEKDCLRAKLVMDAIPRGGRKYRRSGDESVASGESPWLRVASPLPNLFFRQEEEASESRSADRSEESESVPGTDEGGQPPRNFFGKMMDWSRR